MVRQGSWILGLALCLASGSSAQERWTLRGQHAAHGPFTSRLTLERTRDEELRVEREVHYLRDDRRERRSGIVHRRHGERYSAVLTSSANLHDALVGGREGAAELHLKLSEYHTQIQSLVYDEAGSASAAGGRDQQLGSLPRRSGRLLAFSENTARNVLDGGLEVGAGVDLGSFLHVGGWRRIEVLDWIDLSPEQRQSLAQAERPSVWVRSFVRGEIKLPWRIPVAPLGVATLSVGVEPGTRFRYEIEELLPLPEDGSSILSELKLHSFRTFDLPLSVAEAELLSSPLHPIISTPPTMTRPIHASRLLRPIPRPPDRRAAR